MTDITPNLNIAVAEEIPPSTVMQGVVKFFRTKPLGATGAVVVVLFILMAIFAPLIAPYDPEIPNYEVMMDPPSAQHWMGVDEFGRDLLSRIIFGARTAMAIGLIASFVGSTLGLIIGVSSAYFGGWVDMIVQRILDVFMAFPLIILALAIVSIGGAGVQSVIIAIIVPFTPRAARVVRSSALAIREVPYVDAARALGFSHWRIIYRHMLPNVMAPYLIMLTAFMGQAVLLEASLSFLGLGVNEPTPAWGLMLQGGAELYAETMPWVPIYPGLAITLSVFAFNLFGDSLRDVLDPRLRI
ncbi:MAG: ABC transporter permease [SAR324 cluster bacterium]|nr:ABC transporter permease [SAR324 cluster bacterium]